MVALLIASIAISASPPVAAPVRTEISAQASVRITLNGGDYSPGDEVRVQVEPGDDGYLVVFRVDGDGRIRVLFPLDPDLDSYVRGGRRYEIRGRGERSTFLADDLGGTGIVYAALARSPLSFSDFAVDDHWDYEMLRLRNEDDDPEAELATIVRRMAANGRFDFDVIGYRVHDSRTYAGSYGTGSGYDPYYDCLACGYPIGNRVSIHIGSGYGWYDRYDPWLYGDAGYNYYRYGYGYPYGNYGSNWGGRYNPYRPIVVYPTRPRVTPDSPYGYRSRPPQALAGLPGSLAPDLGRNVRPAPREGAAGAPTYDGRSRVRNTTAQGSRSSGTVRQPERTNPPRREAPTERREPQRESRPAERPAERPSERPSAPAPAPSQGGMEGRSRRPNNLNVSERPVSMPVTGAQPTWSPDREVVRAVGRQQERRAEAEGRRQPEPEVRRAREPEVRRQSEPEVRRQPEPSRERPVYREPVRTAPVEREAPRVERPQTQAPRVERPEPAREAPTQPSRSRRQN